MGGGAIERAPPMTSSGGHGIPPNREHTIRGRVRRQDRYLPTSTRWCQVRLSVCRITTQESGIRRTRRAPELKSLWEGSAAAVSGHSEGACSPSAAVTSLPGGARPRPVILAGSHGALLDTSRLRTCSGTVLPGARLQARARPVPLRRLWYVPLLPHEGGVLARENRRESPSALCIGPRRSARVVNDCFILANIF